MNTRIPYPYYLGGNS